MIDREKVIKGLECLAQKQEPMANPCKGCGYIDKPNFAICVKDVASDALALLKEQENRWVSVKDRMPDEAGKYYVSGGGKVWFGEMMCLGGMKGWINSAKNPNVEAWMPPPEAYKKSGEVG